MPEHRGVMQDMLANQLREYEGIKNTISTLYTPLMISSSTVIQDQIEEVLSEFKIIRETLIQ